MRLLLLSICGFLLLASNSLAQESLVQDILSTWDKHVSVNKMLIEAIAEDYLSDTSSSGGRNVGEHFAHMHNVRMMWAGQINAIEAQKLDDVVDEGESLKREYLLKTLEASNKMIKSFLEDGIKSNKQFLGMSPVRFMGYLIAHESHTRGQIMLALKQSGHPLPPQISYGIWEW